MKNIILIFIFIIHTILAPLDLMTHHHECDESSSECSICSEISQTTKFVLVPNIVADTVPKYNEHKEIIEGKVVHLAHKSLVSLKMKMTE